MFTVQQFFLHDGLSDVLLLATAVTFIEDITVTVFRKVNLTDTLGCAVTG